MADDRINVDIETKVSFPPNQVSLPEAIELHEAFRKKFFEGVEEMTPVEELRLAAQTLREFARETTLGRWVAHGLNIDTNELDFVGEASDGCNASWIALMSPDIAEDLATVLEEFTGLADLAGWVDGLTGFPNLQSVVDLARKINRHRDETPLI